MAKVKYDIADVDIQGGSDFTPAPVGLYRFAIASAEVGESGRGQPMLTVVLELTHDAKGKKLKEKYGRVWHRVPLEHWDDTAGWTFRLDELLNALGKKKKGVLDTDKLEGETGMVKLRSGKDQDDNYRPEVGKLMKLSDDEDEEDEEEPEDEDIEDEDEDESEDDDDESEDEDDETYSREELEELSNKDLKEVAEEYEVEDIPQKLTTKSKPKLIDAILAAQDGDEDEEDEEEEDEEEEEEAEDYSEWSRNQLIKEARSRGLKVKKSDDDDTIRGWLIDADSSEEEEDDDEDESEEQDYSDWDLDQLKNELKERGLKSSGSKTVLVKRLEKDDESEDDPF